MRYVLSFIILGHLMIFLSAEHLCAQDIAIKYSYDQAGRLIKATYPKGGTIEYSYDKAGNMLSKSMKKADLPQPVVNIQGVPQSPFSVNKVNLNINGTNISKYKYKLNNGSWSAAKHVNASIALEGLSDGKHSLLVLCADEYGVWQDESHAVKATWLVDAVLAGDVNANGSLDLKDAILAMQVILGMQTDEDIDPGADSDGDDQIGLPELVHILQKLSLEG